MEARAEDEAVADGVADADSLGNEASAEAEAVALFDGIDASAEADAEADGVAVALSVGYEASAEAEEEALFVADPVADADPEADALFDGIEGCADAEPVGE
jgi:hypothetical protein